MSRSSKALVLIIILIALVATVISIKKHQTNVTVTSVDIVNDDNINAAATTSVPSTAWKTYVNNERGFKFSYPEDWKIMDYVQGGPLVAAAPEYHRFRDGTDSPYGFFIIREDKTPTESFDWVDEAFIGRAKGIAVPEHKVYVTLIVPWQMTEADMEEIYSTLTWE